MYKILFACLAASAVLCAILFTSLTYGGPPPETQEVVLKFDRTALKVAKNGGRDFLILRQPRCKYGADAVGAPVIPLRSVRVVVPRGAKFEKVSITNCKTEKLPGKFDLDFVREECPPGAVPPVSQPDLEIYGSEEAFPAEKVEFLRWQRNCCSTANSRSRLSTASRKNRIPQSDPAERAKCSGPCLPAPWKIPPTLTGWIMNRTARGL
jgi:hypothetical protein